MNFDGYQDVRLFDTANGNYLAERIDLIWNPQTQPFERDEGQKNLGNEGLA